MQSIAISTVLILVLLSPGFFFVLGLYAPERFARDSAPQNPLAAFAATVCFAFLSHSLLAFVVHVLGRSVPWQTVIAGLQTAPSSGLGAGPNLGILVETHPLSMFGYVVSSWAAGFALGIVTGKALLRLGLQRLIIRHHWVHGVKVGTTGTITFAHVLSEVAHEGKVLLYRGLLRYFALNANGTFAYIVLSATEQRFLHVDGPTPKTGKLRVIGASTNSDPATVPDRRMKSADQEFLRFSLVVATGLLVVFAPFVSRVALATLATALFGLWWIALRPVIEEQIAGAVMVISGERIMDVVFQGHAVAGLERTTRRAPKALRTLDAAEETAEDVEQHREQLVDLWGGELPTRDVQQLTRRELQKMLRDIGYDPGPIDGFHGPRTDAAVREFQEDSGLTVDGVLGPSTRLYLLLENEALKSG
jgi:hypothetical protein